MAESEKREAYRRRMEAQLDEWEAKIEELKAKSRKAKASTEIEARERLQRLQTKQAEYRQALSELQIRGKDAWQSVKTGMEKAASDLKEAIDDARSSLG